MSQIWSSGGYLFTFDDDGVNAHTLDGILVSGITTGFTPWLVEDSIGGTPAVVIVSPNIVYPMVPMVEPPRTEVPESRFSWGVMVLLIVLYIVWKGKQENG